MSSFTVIGKWYNKLAKVTLAKIHQHQMGECIQLSTMFIVYYVDLICTQNEQSYPIDSDWKGSLTIRHEF